MKEIIYFFLYAIVCYSLSHDLILSSSVIGRTMRQGLPTATTFEGISFTTTEPPPITTFEPMVTPGITCTPAPIHTLSPP